MPSDHGRREADVDWDVESALARDATRISEYGLQHRAEWGGLHQSNEDRLQVFFVGDVEPHRRAIEALVEAPDRIDLRSAKFSLGDIERVRDEIRTRFMSGSPAERLVSSVHRVDDRLVIWLSPEHAATGEKIREKFGEMIELRIGSVESTS